MTPYTGWRCLGCGAGASLVGPSLDARHPLVACQGIHRGKAPLPGTADLDELDHALREVSAGRARNLHARHLAGKLQPDRCHYCAAMLDLAYGAVHHV